MMIVRRFTTPGSLGVFVTKGSDAQQLKGGSHEPPPGQEKQSSDSFRICHGSTELLLSSSAFCLLLLVGVVVLHQCIDGGSSGILSILKVMPALMPHQLMEADVGGMSCWIFEHHTPTTACCDGMQAVTAITMFHGKTLSYGNLEKSEKSLIKRPVQQ